MKNVAAIVTAALQVAIAARSNGQNVEQAKVAARTQFWKDYSPENQQAAERAITGYFASQPAPTFTGPTIVIEDSEPVFGTRLNLPMPKPVATVDYSKSTKAELLVLADKRGIKVFKSWTKDQIIKALTPASAIAA